MRRCAAITLVAVCVAALAYMLATERQRRRIGEPSTWMEQWVLP